MSATVGLAMIFAGVALALSVWVLSIVVNEEVVE